jgi:diguanylate cyclase (GGDEF)-like protein
MAKNSSGTRARSRINFAGIGVAVASGLLGAAGLAFGGIAGMAAAVVVAGAAAAYILKQEPKAVAVPAPAQAPIPAASPPTPAAPAVIPPDRVDSLTGLANENGLMAWFAEKTPRLVEDHRGIVVLSAYLDGLDIITKKHGQAVADKVLIEVGKRVAIFIGPDGIAARTGGGEFASVATVVPDHAETFAADSAANLAEMLQRPVELPEGVVWIGGTVGSAYGPAAEGAGILERARSALERAKAIGLGHYVVDKR